MGILSEADSSRSGGAKVEAAAGTAKGTSSSGRYRRLERSLCTGPQQPRRREAEAGFNGAAAENAAAAGAAGTAADVGAGAGAGAGSGRAPKAAGWAGVEQRAGLGTGTGTPRAAGWEGAAGMWPCPRTRTDPRTRSPLRTRKGPRTRSCQKESGKES